VSANLWTKPTNLSHKPAYRRLWNYIHHRHLLLLSSKADTHFTIPRRLEGWVDLGGCPLTQTVYLPASSHPVTHPSSNQAQCRLTSLNKANVLTTTLRHHPWPRWPFVRVYTREDRNSYKPAKQTCILFSGRNIWTYCGQCGAKSFTAHARRIVCWSWNNNNN